MTTMTRPDQPVAQAHRDATGTEKTAQQHAATRAAVVRDRVLRIVACRADGMTATEAYEAYCQIHGRPKGELYSVSPRLSELSRPGAGFLHKTKRARGGRAVYVVTDKGLAWVQNTPAVAA